MGTSPLRYQATAADCGKTSLTNAFMYLFERIEIPPQAIDFVTRVTGDCNLGVNGYYRGTSSYSLAFVSAWCNDYLAKAGMPIKSEALRDEQVSLTDGSPLAEGLREGAVAVCGCRVGVDHYVLITGIDDTSVRVFDPFYEEFPPTSYELPARGVTWVDDAPFSHNRIVERTVLDDPEALSYSLFAQSGRDAILLWRTSPEPYRWYSEEA